MSCKRIKVYLDNYYPFNKEYPKVSELSKTNRFIFLKKISIRIIYTAIENCSVLGFTKFFSFKLKAKVKKIAKILLQSSAFTSAPLYLILPHTHPANFSCTRKITLQPSQASLSCSHPNFYTSSHRHPLTPSAAANLISLSLNHSQLQPI